MLFLAVCFIITGMIVGILSGLFGLGGGLTIVPLMMVFISVYEPSFSANAMHIAVATSLFVMIFTSTITTYSHHRANNIIWRVAIPIKYGVIIGAILGAILASFLSSKVLKIFFIIFLIYTVIKWAVKSFSKKSKSDNISQRIEPKKILSIIYGGFTGAIAVLLGIGSSVMIVPFLKHKNFTMSQSAAIAAAVTPFIALLGAITYIVTGLSDSMLPELCLGYVYIPAAVGMILGSLIGAPIGTRLSAKITPIIQNIIYFIFLIIILIIMVS
ncbi:sulfite exporter TauE/SafE family protein [Francisella philomiragia]|uniref:sulfite exporter TauE/SafE family protein n=1 Tax=Francisella philomiragia TaxID=28110 RepID=UPI001C9DD5E2|nr:sulfite exporter TauE/SafE family protein [Francisella philomiragia]MBY7733586.1 sulfite exporter TauE/SafE family protein [Francisella philomiragia]